METLYVGDKFQMLVTHFSHEKNQHLNQHLKSVMIIESPTLLELILEQAQKQGSIGYQRQQIRFYLKFVLYLFNKYLVSLFKPGVMVDDLRFPAVHERTNRIDSSAAEQLFVRFQRACNIYSNKVVYLLFPVPLSHLPIPRKILTSYKNDFL